MRSFSIVTKTMDVDNKRTCYTTKYSLLGMPVMRRIFVTVNRGTAVLFSVGSGSAAAIIKHQKYGKEN